MSGPENDNHHSMGKPLLRAAAYERRDIFSVMVYALFSGLLTLVVPVSVQALVNTISFGTLIQPLIILAIIVMVLMGISALCRLLLIVVVESIQRRLFVRLAFDWTRKQARSGRDLDSKKFLEITSIQKACSIFLIDGMAVILQLFLGLLLLAVYHPWFLVFDLLIVLALGFSIFGFYKRGEFTAIQESTAKYEFVEFLENLEHQKFKSREELLAEADASVINYLRRRKSHFAILLFHHLSGFALQVMFSALLLGLGGWLVIQKQLSLGQLVAAELVLTSVLSGASKLGKYLEAYYDLLASYYKAVPREH
jgi:putative ABC transport system ATP-binding protein